MREWVYNDGGRFRSGFKGSTGDCVCRAIAIATEQTYSDVYFYLEHLGWKFTPTMFIGSGCKVHLRHDELPVGRLIVNVSRHMVAVIDGVIHDTSDPTRNGKRCVYGYWTEGKA